LDAYFTGEKLVDQKRREKREERKLEERREKREERKLE
jgi:hypothetical protein